MKAQYDNGEPLMRMACRNSPRSGRKQEKRTVIVLNMQNMSVEQNANSYLERQHQ